MFRVLILSAVFINWCYSAEYYEINGTSYFMSYPLLKNWYEAGRYCTFHGMYLLDIDTEAENNVAASILQQIKTKYNISFALVWTSGTDLGHEGSYYWETTGKPMLYTNWAGHQPDNAGNNEHCIEIQLPAWHWNDRPCLTESSFICQSRLKGVAGKCENCENCQM